MASTRDQNRSQWYLNAETDLLNLENSESVGLDFGLAQTLEPKSFEASSLEIPETDLANLFPSNYEDIDDFLTQELKDLDIPMIPQNLNIRPEVRSPARCDTVWNRDTNVPVQNSHQSHKRGPSGTAIFGFANHNKQLSLTKNNPDENILSGANQLRPSFSGYGAESTDKDYQVQSNNLNSLILKQQEELRQALEKQQEMNAQLEQQLRSSQRQQQQLQLALKEQEYAAQHLTAKVSPARTPSSRTSHPGSDGKNIIITSNSKSGGYKFPAPRSPTADNSKNGVISPVSGTSMNGSPIRKNHSTRNNPQLLHLNVPNNFSDGGEDYSSPENFFGSSNFKPKISAETVQKMSKYFEQVNAKNATSIDRLDTNNPITPQHRVVIGGTSSTSSSPRVNYHRAKESISSSASTIPQLCDDDDRYGQTTAPAGKAVGLGIRSNDENAKRKYLLNKPPPLDLLPTIPGSSDNTPISIKKTPLDSKGLPQKHVFQHTPTKASLGPGSATNSTSRFPTTRPVFKALNEDLRPPSEGENYEYDNQNGEDGPESEFKIAQTPSPILKSQGRFEDSSPYLNHDYYDDNHGEFDDVDHYHLDHEHEHCSHNSSSLKITKKPTTLPPGEIDRYVHELPDKTFQCLYPDCGKTFRRRYNIRSHIQTHLEDRPYHCDYEGCGKAFVRNHDLIRHKKIHAEKSFVCPCGKKFVREDALIVHRSRMICVGGKKFSNVVIKKSPRRRGRPRKDGTFSATSSPVKDSIVRNNNGMIALQMEEQLQRDMIESGLLNPTFSKIDKWSEQ
ncbi:LAME_0G07404g1_1 [Lachancea meyersii CBS 8951]|uniref:LAME_0G07404g1_1 n=1 Tax=Lachancea meyersii CBS 8951 TaxID=1266667 RepID=A0A1G4K7W4_9SACH|nr:LAME_0G07404g1_1 [Lachancea meyersii CBS 8951]